MINGQQTSEAPRIIKSAMPENVYSKLYPPGLCPGKIY